MWKYHVKTCFFFFRVWQQSRSERAVRLIGYPKELFDHFPYKTRLQNYSIAAALVWMYWPPSNCNLHMITCSIQFNWGAARIKTQTSCASAPKRWKRKTGDSTALSADEKEKLNLCLDESRQDKQNMTGCLNTSLLALLRVSTQVTLHHNTFELTDQNLVKYEWISCHSLS